MLSTAVFNQNPYKNLIVNGLVLAQDGKKMSKRLKNYPDPNEVIEKYGADAIRMYLANSPLVRAETLNFKEEGLLHFFFSPVRLCPKQDSCFQHESVVELDILVIKALDQVLPGHTKVCLV